MTNTVHIAGATSKSVEVQCWTISTAATKTDVTTATTNVAAYYRIAAATNVAAVAITLATLTGTAAAWASGGLRHISDGLYRLDLPDAALASGDRVVVWLEGVSDAFFSRAQIDLTGVDPRSSSAVSATIVAGGIDASSFAAGAIDSSAIATDAIDAAAVKADAVTEVANGVLSWEPYTGYSFAKIFRAMGIVLFGTKTGSGTSTEVFTSPADSKTVTAVVDSDGNRSSVTTNASGTP